MSDDEQFNLFPVQTEKVARVKTFFVNPKISVVNKDTQQQSGAGSCRVKISGNALVEMVDNEGGVVEIATGKLELPLDELCTEESLAVRKDGLSVTEIVRNVVDGEMKASEVAFTDILLAAEDVGKVTMLHSVHGDILNIEAELDELFMFFNQD